MYSESLNLVLSVSLPIVRTGSGGQGEGGHEEK